MPTTQKKPLQKQGKPQPTGNPKQIVKKTVEPNESPIKVIRTRNDFVREGSKKLYIAAGVVLFGVIAQCFIAYAAFTAKSERVYIATDKNGSLLTLIPLGLPNQKSEVVAQWIQNALVDTFSFNFSDMKTQLNQATMKWFTEYGSGEFLREMKDAGYMDAVEKEELILSLTAEHTPILVNKPGPNPQTGIYTWIYQVDSILTFRTRGKEFTKKVRMTVWVERRSMLENVDGLGIAKILMTNR
ncbi:DotI/IcmL family type IV secretion protein [Pseudomonas aeruginosa]